MDQKIPHRPLWATALCLGLVALWGCFLPWKRVLRAQNDFLSFYVGGMLANSPDLYEPNTFQRMQEQVARIQMPAVLYSRPPFYAALLNPLTRVPYRTAYFLFVLLNVGALAGCLLLFVPRGDPLRLLGGVSIPVLTALINGQDVLLVLGLCFASIALWRRGWTMLAGLVLSLCAIKFHFFLFVPIALIFRKQWRMLAGTAAGLTALYAVGAAAQGWTWPMPYMRFLQFLRRPDLTPTPYTMPNVHGLMAAFGDASKWEAVAAALFASGAIYCLAKTQDFELSFALAIVAGLLINVHTYIQDCTLLMLVPALAPLDSIARRLGLILLAPPAYFLLMADGPVGILIPAAMAAIIASPMLAWKPKTQAGSTVTASAFR